MAKLKTKKCAKCLEVMDIRLFHKNSLRKSGYHYYCKKCTVFIQKERRAKSLSYQEWLPKRAARAREKRKDGRYKLRDRRNAIKSRLRHPKEWGARQAVSRAIKSEKLFKPNSCMDCKQISPIIHGHHADYNKPLSVEWLCPPCHRLRHPKRALITEPQE